MRSKKEKEKLIAAAKQAIKQLKTEEFECPICGGIASVCCENAVIKAECHACTLRASERMV